MTPVSEEATAISGDAHGRPDGRTPGPLVPPDPAARPADAAADGHDLLRRGEELLAGRHAHQAMTVLERARSLLPDRGAVHETLGRAYYAAYRYADAREAFARAVDLDPASDYGHFGLSLCLLHTGERTLAVGHLRLALAMRPDSETYQRTFDRVAAATATGGATTSGDSGAPGDSGPGGTRGGADSSDDLGEHGDGGLGGGVADLGHPGDPDRPGDSGTDPATPNGQPGRASQPHPSDRPAQPPTTDQP